MKLRKPGGTMAFLRPRLIFSEAQPRVQLGTCVRTKERRVHSKLNREKEWARREPPRFVHFSPWFSANFASYFFPPLPPPPFIFSCSLYIIFLPYWWIACEKYTLSPYVHASRARLNTCTSSSFVCTSRHLFFFLLFYVACHVK